MSNQKYSGVVNLDHPDGTYLYFHDLPPILLKCPYVIVPDQDTPSLL